MLRMERCFVIFAAATFFHLGISSQVPSTGSRGQGHLEEDSRVQIDAPGKAVISGRSRVEDTSLLQVLNKIKEMAVKTRPHDARVMRSEVRRHESSDNTATGRLQLSSSEEVLGLLQLMEVNCSSPVPNVDDVSRKLCNVLEGSSNAQVAGKLERAVKGLSLRPKSANDTQMVVAEHKEDVLLNHLRAALWDLWFCAKRTDYCDVARSQEPKIKAARQEAFDALQAIHTHAETSQSHGEPTKKDLTLSGSVVEKTEKSAGKADAHSKKADAHAASLIEKVATEQAPAPAISASEWATNAMDGLLDPTSGNVTGRLWDAIHNCNLNDVLMQDIITVTDDQDQNMKKLKESMLILHECASMPDCPTESTTECCNPRNPTQAQYLQARNQAYVSYHQITEDTSAAQQAYVQMLRNVAGGGPAPAPAAPAPASHVAAPLSTSLFPPGHPSHKAIPNATVTVTAEEAPEGNVLLYAICGVSGVVVLVIGFLMVKTSQSNKRTGGGGEENWESWEGEQW